MGRGWTEGRSDTHFRRGCGTRFGRLGGGSREAGNCNTRMARKLG